MVFFVKLESCKADSLVADGQVLSPSPEAKKAKKAEKAAAAALINALLHQEKKPTRPSTTHAQLFEGTTQRSRSSFSVAWNQDVEAVFCNRLHSSTGCLH